MIVSEPAWKAANRAHWDEKVTVHLGPHGYDLTSLRAGRGRFNGIEEEELGPVDGRYILHLQCHFGADSLKLVQRGATVVGLDFSAAAIKAARQLASELGLADRACFVQADLYDAPTAIAGAAARHGVRHLGRDHLAARHPPLGGDRLPFPEARRLTLPRRRAPYRDGVR